MDTPLTFVSEATLNQAEFAAWLARHADDNRYELLGGRVIMNPPSSWPEGEGEADLVSLIRAHARAGGLGRVFGPSQGFELPTGDTLAPDVSFISKSRWEAGPPPVQGKFLRIIPDLVVEVVSPSTEKRDRVDKRMVYAQSGVREFWLVDLRRREATVYFQETEGRFDGGRVLRVSDTLTSRVLPGFAVHIADLAVDA